MPLIDPVDLLRRKDKWYLGNAGMLLYAPPFPQHLDVPGFYDECHFGDLALPRLLAVGFAVAGKGDPQGCAGVPPAAATGGRDARPTNDIDGGRGNPPHQGAARKPQLTELVPQLTSWDWYPDRIEARYALHYHGGITPGAASGLELAETRSIGPDSTLHCHIGLSATSASAPRQVHVIAWSGRKTRTGDPEGACENFTDLGSYGSSISYRFNAMRRSHGRGDKPLPLEITMAGAREPDSLRVICSHGADIVPRLDYTALWDELKSGGRLSGKVEGNNPLGGVVYAGLHWQAEVAPGADWATEVTVAVRDPASGSRPVPGAAGSRPQEGTPGHQSGVTPDPAKAWREFIDLIPHFECSDEMLTRYYWYRWFGLRLNAVPAGGNYCAPGVTEGISYFRGVITYSLMCHLFECKWLADPALAQGCLRNHIAHQTRAGHFPGHIYVSHANTKGFYHTDIGRSLAELLLHHPDKQFIGEVDEPLRKLLGFYVRERDPEGFGLYDVRDQFETGQEFTSRYFHSDERADMYGWEHKLKLKGVDVTVYVYHLARLLEQLALLKEDTRAVRQYAELAARTRIAVREFLWDDERRFWFDYSTEKRSLSPYWVAVGFYPILSDLATDEHALAAAAHLDGADKFATSYPTPTVSTDDPNYSADPRWRGERANCPWNGRVWPMVNSHIAEVLYSLARRDESYRARVVPYLRRYIEMMHYESSGAKDLTRPNCFEHYHPGDGSACEYRGIDDYQHSWVADLILKYICGVRFEDGRLVVDPLPGGPDGFLLKNCHIAGAKLDVCWNRDRRGADSPGFRVFVNGSPAHRSDSIERWEVEL